MLNNVEKSWNIDTGRWAILEELLTAPFGLKNLGPQD